MEEEITKEETFTSVYNHKIILDLSCLVDLNRILTRMNNAAIKYSDEFNKGQDIVSSEEKEKFVIYIPDTIEKLLKSAKLNPKYYQYFFNLMSKWSKEEIDIILLEKILKDKKFENVDVKVIDDNAVKNAKSYYIAYEKFKDENLITHFSPELNLVGDVIGKILGMSELHNSMILMRNQHLITEIKKQIPVFLDNTQDFRNLKIQFFEANVPGLSALSGTNWLIGGILQGIGLKKNKKIINLAGLVFFALDP